MPGVLNIAHRGARSLAPENTLLAGHKGLESGADMWEIDVGVTADGELVIMHDDTLTRTTNAQAMFPHRAPWQCVDFTLAELKQLDAGSFFVDNDPFGQIAAGAVAVQELAAMRGATIPTLQEALLFTRTHNWRVNIEIKEVPAQIDPQPVVEKIMALIEALDMVGQVLLSSFVHPYLQQAKAINPAIATGALCYLPVADPVGLLQTLKADAFHPSNQIVTQAQVEAVRRAGFEVNVWTVNELSEMARLIEFGVNGLFTDFPQRLRQLQV